MPNLPFVSVLTLTYERRQFLPVLMDIFLRQTYPPLHRRELVILDDSENSNQDIVDEFCKRFPEVIIRKKR